MKKLFITLFALSAVTAFAVQAHVGLDDATVDVQVTATIGSATTHQLIITDNLSTKTPTPTIVINHGNLTTDSTDLIETSTEHYIVRKGAPTTPLFSSGQSDVELSFDKLQNGVLTLTNSANTTTPDILTTLSTTENLTLNTATQAIPFTVTSKLGDLTGADGTYTSTTQLTVTVK